MQLRTVLPLHRQVNLTAVLLCKSRLTFRTFGGIFNFSLVDSPISSNCRGMEAIWGDKVERFGMVLGRSCWWFLYIWSYFISFISIYDSRNPRINWIPLIPRLSSQPQWSSPHFLLSTRGCVLVCDTIRVVGITSRVRTQDRVHIFAHVPLRILFISAFFIAYLLYWCMSLVMRYYLCGGGQPTAIQTVSSRTFADGVWNIFILASMGLNWGTGN